MNPVKIKICGITREQDLMAAGTFGADAMGLVVGVPTSPRNISIEKARTFCECIPSYMTSVLVTVPKSVSELQHLYQQIQPDAIQIHGDHLTDISKIRQQIPASTIVKAINVTQETAAHIRLQTQGYDAVLLDSHQAGHYGGTGHTHDWTMSQQLKSLIHPTCVILAGGLTPKNVQTAIRIVDPYAVDVSTGIESRPGIKDPEKMRLFITNVKKLGG
jgi:phosphoribosylanthranilate isomerase